MQRQARQQKQRGSVGLCGVAAKLKECRELSQGHGSRRGRMCRYVRRGSSWAWERRRCRCRRRRRCGAVGVGVGGCGWSVGSRGLGMLASPAEQVGDPHLSVVRHTKRCRSRGRAIHALDVGLGTCRYMMGAPHPPTLGYIRPPGPATCTGAGAGAGAGGTLRAWRETHTYTHLSCWTGADAVLLEFWRRGNADAGGAPARASWAAGPMRSQGGLCTLRRLPAASHTQMHEPSASDRTPSQSTLKHVDALASPDADPGGTCACLNLPDPGMRARSSPWRIQRLSRSLSSSCSFRAPLKPRRRPFAPPRDTSGACSATLTVPEENARRACDGGLIFARGRFLALCCPCNYHSWLLGVTRLILDSQARPLQHSFTSAGRASPTQVSLLSSNPCRSLITDHQRMTGNEKYRSLASYTLYIAVGLCRVLSVPLTRC